MVGTSKVGTPVSLFEKVPKRPMFDVFSIYANHLSK